MSMNQGEFTKKLHGISSILTAEGVIRGTGLLLSDSSRNLCWNCVCWMGWMWQPGRGWGTAHPGPDKDKCWAGNSVCAAAVASLAQGNEISVQGMGVRAHGSTV